MGKDSLSQALIALPQDDGRSSAPMSLNLCFHLCSSIEKSSGEGRSAEYISTVSSTTRASRSQIMDRTSPKSFIAYLERSENCALLSSKMCLTKGMATFTLYQSSTVVASALARCCWRPQARGLQGSVTQEVASRTAAEILFQTWFPYHHEGLCSTLQFWRCSHGHSRCLLYKAGG